MPSPVSHRTTVEPACAGWAAELTVPWASTWMTPWPKTLRLVVKKPGAVEKMAIGNGSESTPWYSTWIWLVDWKAPK